MTLLHSPMFTYLLRKPLNYKQIRNETSLELETEIVFTLDL